MKENINVLYEDDYIIIIDKPEGIAIHKNEFMPKDQEVLLSMLGKESNLNLFPIHRLDAKTSGVLMISKSKDNTSKFSQLFERHEIRKVYLALCLGNPLEGTWNHEVRAGRKTRKMKSASTSFYTEKVMSLPLSYNEVKEVIFSLVHLFPKTGRWHQLRQHCAYERHDIIGDRLHGNWDLNKALLREYDFGRLFLHAYELSFIHPLSNEEITVTTRLPEEFNLLMQKAHILSTDTSENMDASG